MSETYVCARCQDAVERNFEVRSIIRTCGECGENGPDGWEQMTLDEQFEAALKEGLITVTRK